MFLGDTRGKEGGRTGHGAADGALLSAEVDKGRNTGEGRILAPVQDVSSAGCEGGSEVKSGEEEDEEEHLAGKWNVLLGDLLLQNSKK